MKVCLAEMMGADMFQHYRQPGSMAVVTLLKRLLINVFQTKQNHHQEKLLSVICGVIQLSIAIIRQKACKRC